MGNLTGEDAGHKQRIHEMRQAVDAKVLHSDNVWAGSTGRRALSVENADQGGVVVRNDDTDTERTTNEENPKTPVNGLERLLDRDAGIDSFSGNLVLSVKVVPRAAATLTIAIYSGPTTVHAAVKRDPRKPSNLPKDPVVMYSAKAPGSLQYLKPYASPCGLPPTMVMKVKKNRMMMRSSLPDASQNSASPYQRTEGFISNGPNKRKKIAVAYQQRR